MQRRLLVEDPYQLRNQHLAYSIMCSLHTPDVVRSLQSIQADQVQRPNNNLHDICAQPVHVLPTLLLQPKHLPICNLMLVLSRWKLTIKRLHHYNASVYHVGCRRVQSEKLVS